MLVLALYIASGAAQMLYSRHQLGLNAHRGRRHHDPLVFAMRDRRSRILVTLMLAAAAAAV